MMLAWMMVNTTVKMVSHMAMGNTHSARSKGLEECITKVRTRKNRMEAAIIASTGEVPQPMNSAETPLRWGGVGWGAGRVVLGRVQERRTVALHGCAHKVSRHEAPAGRRLAQARRRRRLRRGPCSLDVGEGVGVLGPDDGVAAIAGQGHADKGAGGGVGGGHLELQGAGEDVPAGAGGPRRGQRHGQHGLAGTAAWVDKGAAS